ncbi:MAG: SGNH/GDSL hydrolase family protein [Streptosporangiales bacterium]|nr:SGNH/GDSL hydrolase family protein [Streptosporangiales bacterium]
MTRAQRARKIAAAAAYGGGGLTLLGAASFALLVAEARLARKWVGTPDGDAPTVDGVYGSGKGDPVSLVMIGDSSAAGIGVYESQDSPAALLADGLSAVAERPVRLINVAKSGAQAKDLDGQVEQALEADPDLAVIMIGANDVTHRVKPSVAVRHLERAVRRLRETGCEVIVGTCPDLGTVEPIAQPLRWLTRRWCRQLAAAQTIAAVEAGGRTVSLGDLLGPEFAANPKEMFGPDRFHPSARGYAAAAAAVLPSMCAALGMWPETEALPDPRRGEGVLPVYLAAAEAVEEPGTEVAGTRVAGKERGPRGRWAMLVRRRQRGFPAPDDSVGAEETISGWAT